MLIDPFTIIAQIVNFLVLVLLLRRFLYRPIIKAMDRREERIASRLEEAEKIKGEAEREAESYRSKNREFEGERLRMLAAAEEGAQAERKALTKKARAEVDEAQAKWYEAIEREKVSFLQDLKRRTSKQVYTIAGRAWQDLANADLERHIVDTFIDRLGRTDGEEREAIRAGVVESGRVAVFRSAFAIPQEVRLRFTKAVHDRIAPDIDVRFERGTDFICGIEMRSNGNKVAWNMADYLGTLEEEVTQAFEEEVRDG